MALSLLTVHIRVLILMFCIQDTGSSRIKRFLADSPPIKPGSYQWSLWSSWSQCNATCSINGGAGSKTRTRFCDDGRHYVNLLNCIIPVTGSPDPSADKRDTNALISGHVAIQNGTIDMEIETCQTYCPQHVNVWSDWGTWTRCSASCDYGTRSRYRHCTTGSDCIGLRTETSSCAEQRCQINGQWSSWTEFGDCSKTCGNGVTFRTRQCNHPGLQNGGQTCIGNSHDIKACKTADCPIDGGWSAWTGFGDCSRSCGGNSVQYRLRSCNNPSPQNGGHNCTGSQQEIRSCPDKPCPINGEWSSWTEFGECSTTCAIGVTFRTRQCNHPIPLNGGKICIGNSQDFKPCKKSDCPTDGGWSAWTGFGDCSRSCGGNGVQYRLRSCTNPSPQNGGLNCTGSPQETRSCPDNHCPINGEWSSWTEFGECSTTCAIGVTFRTRQCNHPIPLNGGKICIGNSQDFKPCKKSDCPTDGGWSAWTGFGDCSRSCGGNGVQYRLRSCTNPSPQNGGLNCTGSPQETRSCPDNHCPINGGWSSFTHMTCSATCGNGVMTSFRTCTNPKPEYGGNNCTGLAYNFSHCHNRNCVVNEWSGWSDWSDCSATCANGIKMRIRTCSSADDCIGESQQTDACAVHPCPKAVDGHWGSWLDWTNCTSSCGNGSKTRTRLCDSPAPQNGGQFCTGTNTETQACFLKQCPIDGGWSNYTVLKCSVTCGRGQQISLRDCNNPPPQFGGKDCEGLSHNVKECNMPPCSIDGNWSNWSQFSMCGSICGDGYTLRYRICSNPAPQNGGSNCTGNSEQRIPCNNGPCRTGT